MKFNTCYSNINGLWSALLIEELYRLGVRHVCIAPGSRSAPLTLMAAEHKGLTRHIHFDERGLGFYALGMAKASQQPVVLITTSGTAVANLYPAVIEARQTSVPLIVLTADRPPELVDCGANQAIEQQDIYSGYPGAVLNIPAPNLDIAANWVLTSLDQAFARSCQQGLPLHVNCRFREPLYPDGTVTDYSDYLTTASQWLASDQPHTVYQLPAMSQEVSQSLWNEFSQRKGVIVAGRLDAGYDSEAIVRLAKKLGWPLLADVQSQLHGHPAAVQHTDLLLLTEKGRSTLKQAECIFQVGGHLLSKRLDHFIGQQNWKHYLMLGRETRRLDTSHRQTLRIVGDIASTCDRLVEMSKNDNKPWATELYQSGASLREYLSDRISNNELTEHWLCSGISGWLPEKCSLFVGNSLPIRLMEMYSHQPVANIFTNRGVSGIDGLMATAAGCAQAVEGPMVMLVGDLSFLHDLNSLQLARQVNKPFVIILVNNDGGNIFNMLPMGAAKDKASDYFVTPHGLDGRHAAAMFGIPYYSPEQPQSFRDQLDAALEYNGCTLIEVKTRPEQATDTIKALNSELKELL